MRRYQLGLRLLTPLSSPRLFCPRSSPRSSLVPPTPVVRPPPNSAISLSHSAVSTGRESGVTGNVALGSPFLSGSLAFSLSAYDPFCSRSRLSASRVLPFPPRKRLSRPFFSLLIARISQSPLSLLSLSFSLSPSVTLGLLFSPILFNVFFCSFSNACLSSFSSLYSIIFFLCL